MFNISFAEMLIIGIVALIVIGPEKLPKVARSVGLLLGKAQRFASSIKSEIDNELQAEDLKRLKDELHQHELGLNDALKQGMKPVKEVIQETEHLKAIKKQDMDKTVVDFQVSEYLNKEQADLEILQRRAAK